MVSPADVPAEVRSQQYSRCALYLSHIEPARKHIAPRLGEGLTAIEFGGSNGFLAELLDGVTYEVALQTLPPSTCKTSPPTPPTSSISSSSTRSWSMSHDPG